MNSTVRNLVILGAAMLFVIVSLVYVEIDKSQRLIALAKDPAASADRGFHDAEIDIADGYVHFKHINRRVPGISEESLEGKYKDFAPFYSFKCGYGWHIEEYALDLTVHEHNEYYVLAYNTKVKQFADKKLLTKSSY